MPKREKKKKSKKEETSAVDETKEGKEKEEKKRKGRRRTRKEKIDPKKIAEIENNAYNLLFDEINLFLHELPHMSLNALRQRLVLILCRFLIHCSHQYQL